MKQNVFLLFAFATSLVACNPSPKQVSTTEIVEITNTLPQKKTDVYNVDSLVKDDCNNPELWTGHLKNDLMKFWDGKDIPEGKSVFFSTFRGNDGQVIPEDSTQWPEEYKEAMKDEDLVGLVEEATKYNYIRAHSRQTFAYGIAYNMTGDTSYLQICRLGAMAILQAMDENNGILKVVNGWILPLNATARI